MGDNIAGQLGLPDIHTSESKHSLESAAAAYDPNG